MAAPKIRVVSTARDLRDFIDLAYRLNAADPAWVPPLRIDLRARLSRKQNPFFEHGEADYFLAERDGKWAEALESFSNVVRLDPAHETGYRHIVACHRSLGNTGKMTRAMEAVVDLAEDDLGMGFALAAGYAAAFPVNYILVGKGVRHIH